MTSVVARGGKPGRGKSGGVGRGSKNSFPRPEPSSPRSHSLQPDSTGNSLHKYPIFLYMCVYVYICTSTIHRLKVSKKQRGWKCFRCFVYWIGRKGLRGLLGLRRRFRDEWNFELARVERIIGRTGQSGGNRGKQRLFVFVNFHAWWILKIAQGILTYEQR